MVHRPQREFGVFVRASKLRNIIDGPSLLTKPDTQRDRTDFRWRGPARSPEVGSAERDERDQGVAPQSVRSSPPPAALPPGTA